MKRSLPLMLLESIGLNPLQFLLLARRAPDTYKHYTIEKKTGGDRWIAQPAKETKLIQRWLMGNVFFQFPIHQCATAYKSGASIMVNATLHAKNSYLAKFDFHNFFNSIKYHNVKDFLSAHLSDRFEADDIVNMAKLSCVREDGAGLCLSVGAPSSPLLSNAILYEFDSLVSSWCQDHSIEYTRYADDLTFSTNIRGACADIHPFLISLLKESDSPALRLNEKKTLHASKKSQRRVTGLILSNEGKISIGRQRKREISAMIDRFRHERLTDENTYLLQGLLGFAKGAEPTFIDSMNRKYGNEIVASIFSLRKPKGE
jgi:hypothetical protein